MADFNLASILADSVSALDTGYIECIPLQKIQADPNNFYSMDGIDALASNIALCGLLDPIRVRRNGDAYTIVSGHRRFAAVSLLAQEYPQWQSIPAIVETTQYSPAMQELRLIYANADTRKLSSADLGKEVERVTALLYQLQEEGYSFPGRMRDHVAEACKLSKSKIARLNAIRKGLGTKAQELYQKGKINETVAYHLSGISKSHQNVILTAMLGQKVPLVDHYLGSMSDCLKSITQMPCPKGGTCGHLPGKMDIIAKDKHNCSYTYCEKRCCLKCDRLVSCKKVCIHAVEAQGLAKEHKKISDEAAKEEKKAEAERLKRADMDAVAKLTAMYQVVAKQLQALDLPIEPLLEQIALWHAKTDFKKYADGDFYGLSAASSVLCCGASLREISQLCNMADYLHLTLDQLLLREPAEPMFAPAQPAWYTGTPTELGAYVAEVELSPDSRILKVLYMLPYFDTLSISKVRHTPVGVPILRWMHLPDGEPVPAPAPAAPAPQLWQTQSPTEPGCYAVQFQDEGFRMVCDAYWDADRRKFSLDPDRFIECDNQWIAWVKLPDLFALEG